MMKYLPLFLLLFTFSCKASDSASSSSTALSVNSIPTATIQVDGDTTDWVNVTTFYNDASSDAVTSDPNTDLSKVYFAEDGTNIYVRLEVSGEITMPHTTSADSSAINVAIQPYFGDCATSTKLTGMLVAYVSANSTSSSSILDEYEEELDVKSGTSQIITSSSGNTLEMEIPKANFFDTTTHITLTLTITSDLGGTLTTHDTLDPNTCFTLATTTTG